MAGAGGNGTGSLSFKTKIKPTAPAAPFPLLKRLFLNPRPVITRRRLVNLNLEPRLGLGYRKPGAWRRWTHNVTPEIGLKCYGEFLREMNSIPAQVTQDNISEALAALLLVSWTDSRKANMESIKNILNKEIDGPAGLPEGQMYEWLKQLVLTQYGMGEEEWMLQFLSREEHSSAAHSDQYGLFTLSMFIETLQNIQAYRGYSLSEGANNYSLTYTDPSNSAAEPIELVKASVTESKSGGTTYYTTTYELGAVDPEHKDRSIQGMADMILRGRQGKDNTLSPSEVGDDPEAMLRLFDLLIEHKMHIHFSPAYRQEMTAAIKQNAPDMAAHWEFVQEWGTFYSGHSSKHINEINNLVLINAPQSGRKRAEAIIAAEMELTKYMGSRAIQAQSAGQSPPVSPPTP